MSTGVSLKNRRVGRGEASVVIPAGVTANRPTQPITGSIRFNTDAGRMELFNGVNWLNLSIEGVVDIVVDKFTGDGGTANFGPLSQTVANTEDVFVFVGNVWQAPVDNFDILGGNSVGFSNAPANGIDIHVIHNINSNKVS